MYLNFAVVFLMKTPLLMLIHSKPKSTFNSILGRKKSRQKFSSVGFSKMIHHKPSLYKEILKCYEYETRNTSVHGNVILRKVELAKSSRKC